MAVLEVLRKTRAYFFMLFLQAGFAGMYVISVASLKQGMNHYVLVVYRNGVAAIVMAPFALWFERKTRPKMTISIFFKIMLMALLEPVLDQNFYYAGAKLTSASFSAAMYNMLPAITFVLAIILRMEKLTIFERRGQVKILGTLITVVGAIVMIMYKGSNIGFPWTKGRAHHEEASSSHDSSDWLKGTFLLIGSCFCWSAFFIVQSNTLKSFPAELTLTTWICAMGAAQSAAVTLVATRGGHPWSIGFDMRLLTAVYSGIMCSGVAYYVQGIVMKERGPVFVTAFNPLCMIIVAIMGSFILAEEISTGRAIGALIIVVGLYMLIWGKSKDYELQKGEMEIATKLPISKPNGVSSEKAIPSSV